MNNFMWMFAGGVLGWLGYSLLRINIGRGRMVAIVIGAMGGFIGGKLIAPMFTAAAIPGDFSMSALFFAAGVATLFLTAANLIHNRWGV